MVKKFDLREIDLILTLQCVQQGEIIATWIAEVPLVYVDKGYCRDFITTRLNVEVRYLATELVKRGVGCSITNIFTAHHNLTPEMIHHR